MWLAGIDGCPAGWVAAFVQPSGDGCALAVFTRFADALTSAQRPAVVAVDVPIGLPERTGHGGRAAENAVRPLLGARQSSVFSVPSRAAVYAEVGPFADEAARYAAHRRASAIAQATSDPPRRISIQAFGIFPKITEVDALLLADTSLTRRVFETHPEVAFYLLNGETPLSEPKKKRNRPWPPGLALRRQLLRDAGLPAALIDAAPPKGAAEDDVLDALACAAIARRIHAGVARPFPDPPPRDAYGLPMAIWT